MRARAYSFGRNNFAARTIMNREKCNEETISFLKETTTLLPSKQKPPKFIVNTNLLYIYIYIDPVLFYSTLTEN